MMLTRHLVVDDLVRQLAARRLAVRQLRARQGAYLALARTLLETPRAGRRAASRAARGRQRVPWAAWAA